MVVWTWCRKGDGVGPGWEQKIWRPWYPNRLGSVQCRVPEFARTWKSNVHWKVLLKYRGSNPQGWPETDVFVRQEMPRRMCPCRLIESGFVLRRSRNLSEAMVAMRKHPSVMISAGLVSVEMIRFSQAARTASGIGVASDLSNGIRVFDLRKSQTVWLWREASIGRSSFNEIQRRALMCVVILVLEDSKFFFFLKRSEAWR